MWMGRVVDLRGSNGLRHAQDARARASSLICGASASRVVSSSNSSAILLNERLARIGWRRLHAILDGLDVIPGLI